MTTQSNPWEKRKYPRICDPPPCPGANKSSQYNKNLFAAKESAKNKIGARICSKYQTLLEKDEEEEDEEEEE
jgi:hypothetical protein